MAFVNDIVLGTMSSFGMEWVCLYSVEFVYCSYLAKAVRRSVSTLDAVPTFSLLDMSFSLLLNRSVAKLTVSLCVGGCFMERVMGVAVNDMIVPTKTSSESTISSLSCFLSKIGAKWFEHLVGEGEVNAIACSEKIAMMMDMDRTFDVLDVFIL